MVFEAYNADGIRAVDNRLQAHWINQGKTQWKTLLWVKRHSILSFYAGITQVQHVFSTDLPLAEQL